MSESEIVFDEKVITSKEDKKWQKQFKKFKNAFIGTDQFASKCTIENPWILDFYNENGSFKATANGQVLVIKNNALGYQINYLLNSFSKNSSFTSYSGFSGFVELEPESNSQFKKWLHNRSIAYNGSLRHFVKSVMNDQLIENGYEAYHLKPKPGEKNVELHSDADKHVTRQSFFERDKIAFKNIVRVFYHNELSNGRSQSSTLQLKKPIKVHPNGEIKDPFSMIIQGHMGYEAFANFLPMEYEPNK